MCDRAEPGASRIATGDRGGTSTSLKRHDLGLRETLAATG